MKLKIILNLVLGVGLLSMVDLASAQTGGSFNLSWSTCSVGSTKSTDAGCSVNGTIGQSQVGTCIGNGISLTAGFWPGALAEIGPTLNITSSAGSVVLSWPASASGFHLQHCADLVRRNWVSNTTPTLTFGEDAVVVEPAAGARFYRLIKP